MEISYRIWLFLLVATNFISFAVADITKFDISAPNDRSFFINHFWFRGTGGHVHLNVTDISFSRPPVNSNLSRIGFYLSHNKIPAKNACSESSTVVYTLDTLSGIDSNNFSLTYSDVTDGMCILYFQNCLDSEDDALTVSMNVESSMYTETAAGVPLYLSAEKFNQNKIHFLFVVAYVILAMLWSYNILCFEHRMLCKIHVFMIVVPLCKACGLLMEILNNFYILHGGVHCLLLEFTRDFLCETPLLILLILVCSGWSFVKPQLASKDKIVLTCLICLNAFSCGMRTFWVAESEGLKADYIFPDLTTQLGATIGLCVLFFTIRSSTKLLWELGSIRYIALFQTLFVLYLFYILFLEIVVAPFEIFSTYLVLCAFLKESVRLAFFIFLGINFTPDIHSLVLDDDPKRAASISLPFNAFMITAGEEVFFCNEKEARERLVTTSV